jgi:hypothetical protein
MNTNVLAISNIFGGTANVGPNSTTPKEVKQSNQFSSQPLESKPLEYSRGTETVDNPQPKNKNNLDNETPLEFGHTLRGQILPQLPLKAKNNVGTKKQNQPTDTAIQPTLIQLKAAECLQNAQQSSEGAANKTELKAGYENARLQTNLKPQDSPLLDGKTAAPHQIEPLKVISQTQNGPTENSPQTPRRPLITDLPSNKGETENRIQNPNTRLRAIRGPYEEQNGDELDLQALIRSQQRTASANGKLEVLPVSNAPGNPKTPQLAGEQLAPEPPVNNNSNSGKNGIGQKPDITDKPDIPNARKPDPGILPIQDKPFRSGLEKFHLIPEHAIESKAAAGEPHRIQTQQFRGPQVDDVMEQGYNSPGTLTYQHLHRAQHQMSTGPIKGRDSSASGNSNSDSGFAAVLSGGNSPTYMMEQTSAFSEATKNENLPPETPLRDIAASITEKMLESVHSSSSQEAGTHQITLRLNPPELGKVYIKFEEQDNQIAGLLEVSKAQTRYEVERALPSIIQNLADSGIEIKRLEVMLTNQGEQQSSRDELLQDGLFQQHHYFPEDNNPNNSGAIGADEPGIFDNESGYQDSPGAQAQFTATSINILI